MDIPQDPFMLLSFINMKLRDQDYENFDDLCSSFGINPDEIKTKLARFGFEYNPEANRFG